MILPICCCFVVLLGMKFFSAKEFQHWLRYQIMESCIKHTLEFVMRTAETIVGIKKLYWFIYYLLDHYAQTMSLLFFLLNSKDFYGICGRMEKQDNSISIGSITKESSVIETKPGDLRQNAPRVKKNLWNQIYLKKKIFSNTQHSCWL